MNGVVNVLRATEEQKPLFEELCSVLGRPVVPTVDSTWHPKYAGVPFILGLANRVLMEDLKTVVKVGENVLFFFFPFTKDRRAKEP